MNEVPLTILIHAHVSDLHSRLVGRALQERGHRVVCNFNPELGAGDFLTLNFESNSQTQVGNACLQVGHEQVDLDQVDVVWNGNPGFPRRHGDPSHVGRDHARAQIRMAQESMCVLAEGAFWINPLPAARRSVLKPLQLRMAPAAGLAIPASLVSNSPAAIRAFVDRHGSVMGRPLHGGQMKGLMSVDEAGGLYAGIRINRENMPSDEILQAVPLLYQACQSQQQHVRVQFFGDTSFAVQVVSPSDGTDIPVMEVSGAVGDTTLLPVELPRTIHRSCKILMDSLKLVACAFDFLLAPNGDWTFVELHEASPFMFIERECPELPVLDAFCAFLESRDADFVYRPSRQPSRLETMEQVYGRALWRRHERRRHAAGGVFPCAIA